MQISCVSTTHSTTNRKTVEQNIQVIHVIGRMLRNDENDLRHYDSARSTTKFDHWEVSEYLYAETIMLNNSGFPLDELLIKGIKVFSALLSDAQL